MNNIFDNDEKDDKPFVPTYSNEPAKKRGRPAGASAAAKLKPKISKPKYVVPRYNKTDLVEALMGVAAELTPPGATYAEQMRVAADLLDMIEKAKA